MADDVRVHEIATASVADLGNQSICAETGVDSDLGYKMWGGKDADGNVTKWLSKDKPIKVTSIEGTTLQLTTGSAIDEISTSTSFTGAANDMTFTGLAIKTYVDTNASGWTRDVGGFLYPTNTLDEVRVTEYIRRYSETNDDIPLETDDYIQLENDKIRIVAGGQNSWIVEDDRVYTIPEMMMIGNNGATYLSDWGRGVLQIGTGAFWGDTGVGVSNQSVVSSNIYFDGSVYKRMVDDEYSMFKQVDGVHRWYVGAAGTAGADLGSLDSAMTLNNSGVLSLKHEPLSNWGHDAVIQLDDGSRAGDFVRCFAIDGVDHSINHNIIYDDTNSRNEYQATDGASLIGMGDSFIQFAAMPSGTAGDHVFSATPGTNLIGITNSATELNENQEDVDFEVNWDGGTALFIEGSSGNVGVGKSLVENWHGAWTALQIGGNMAIMAGTSEESSSSSYISQNLYYDGGWKRITNDESSYIFQQNGGFGFYSIGAGAADAPIIPEPKFTISNSGDVKAVNNMIIGETNLSSWNSVYSVLQTGGTASIFNNTSASSGAIVALSQNLYNDGVYKRLINDEATTAQQKDGEFLWRSAVAGSADVNLGAALSLKMRLGLTGNLTLGDITEDASAVRVIHLAEGTAPAAGVTNTGCLWSQDDSGTTHVYVQDSAGYQTKLSPHDDKGDWEYYSKNIDTGETVRINMIDLVREVEKLSGKTLIKDQ